MSGTAKSLGIDRLSVAERILLVEEIWDGIAAETHAVEVPEAHKEELDRRLEAYRQDPTAGSSWAEVKQRLAEPSEPLK